MYCMNVKDKTLKDAYDTFLNFFINSNTNTQKNCKLRMY